MSQHADEPLPRLELLLTQGPADVREHEQLVRKAALAERGPVHAPARCGSRLARKGLLQGANRIARETVRQAQVGGVLADHPLDRLGQQPLSRAVHQLEAPLAVEGEHRHIDLLHHLAKQGRRFERPQPLLLERVPQRVHFDHDLAQRLVTLRSARPDGIVSLAQRGENVGERLQRTRHPLPDAEGEAEPDRDNQDRKRPLRLRGVVPSPEQEHRHQHGGNSRRQRQQQDAVLKAEFSTLGFRSGMGRHGKNYEL